MSLTAAIALLCQHVSDFDAKVEAILKEAGTVGCAIAYAEEGVVKFAKGYGFANLEHRVPMKPESVHELASVSKQFTAVAVLQLVEKGSLSLDDKLSKFFEGAHSDWSKVTIRHLLHHTSGVADYLDALKDFGLDYTDQQMVDSIREGKLAFEPGTKFEYSNSGYMLLGLIVAKVSKMRFGEYTEKNVLEMAGMKTAVYNDSLRLLANRADGYSLSDGRVSREPFTSTSLSGTGDGHVMASALDLVAWDEALRKNMVLGEAMQRAMSEPSPASRRPAEELPPFARDLGYGFGVSVGRIDGHLVQQHSGGWYGTTTLFVRYVDEKRCIVILCNTDDSPNHELLSVCELEFLGKAVITRRPDGARSQQS